MTFLIGILIGLSVYVGGFFVFQAIKKRKNNKASK
jgi:hypothetical protein